MDDLISRQAAIDALNAEGITKNMRAHRRILSLPSAERHGRWINCGWSIKCSICDYDMPFSVRNYCPNCGAKMDEVEE